jgi:hypothetical protein
MLILPLAQAQEDEAPSDASFESDEELADASATDSGNDDERPSKKRKA